MIALQTLIVLFMFQLVLAAFEPLSHTNFVNYWGQNQASAGRGSRNTWQKPLGSYCTDDTEDILVISFLYQFGIQPPAIDLSDSSDECVGNFPGTQLLDCPHMEPDIQECQSRDKIVLLSLGGATGAYGLSSATQGRALADTLWNTFGGGNSNVRPFGDAKVDGFDLDIEAGPTAGYPAFIERMREHYASDTSKQYYISGAPQCPFPDEYLSETLNNAWFDFVWVQFYNNYCSITSNQFNYATWDEWARTRSVNKNVRLFLGVPGSSYAAGQGYVSYNDLTKAITQTASRYPTFGGVMMWDASAAYANTEAAPNFAQAVAQFLHRHTVVDATLNRIPSGNISATASALPAEPTSSATPVSLYPPQPSVQPPVEGTFCSDVTARCAGKAIAQCAHDVWIYHLCPLDLVCHTTIAGGAVYCGYPGKRDTYDNFNSIQKGK